MCDTRPCWRATRSCGRASCTTTHRDTQSAAAALEALIRDAVDALAEHPRDDKLLRAVDRTYLRPAATQESAAAMLGLPFSTYRRHLTQGVARIIAWLWERVDPGAFPGARAR